MALKSGAWLNFPAKCILEDVQPENTTALGVSCPNVQKFKASRLNDALNNLFGVVDAALGCRVLVGGHPDAETGQRELISGSCTCA